MKRSTSHYDLANADDMPPLPPERINNSFAVVLDPAIHEKTVLRNIRQMLENELHQLLENGVVDQDLMDLIPRVTGMTLEQLKKEKLPLSVRREVEQVSRISTLRNNQQSQVTQQQPKGILKKNTSGLQLLYFSNDNPMPRMMTVLWQLNHEKLDQLSLSDELKKAFLSFLVDLGLINLIKEKGISTLNNKNFLILADFVAAWSPYFLIVLLQKEVMVAELRKRIEGEINDVNCKRLELSLSKLNSSVQYRNLLALIDAVNKFFVAYGKENCSDVKNILDSILMRTDLLSNLQQINEIEIVYIVVYKLWPLAKIFKNTTLVGGDEFESLFVLVDGYINALISFKLSEFYLCCVNFLLEVQSKLSGSPVLKEKSDFLTIYENLKTKLSLLNSGNIKIESLNEITRDVTTVSKVMTDLLYSYDLIEKINDLSFVLGLISERIGNLVGDLNRVVQVALGGLKNRKRELFGKFDELTQQLMPQAELGVTQGKTVFKPLFASYPVSDRNNKSVEELVQERNADKEKQRIAEEEQQRTLELKRKQKTPAETKQENNTKYQELKKDVEYYAKYSLEMIILMFEDYFANENVKTPDKEYYKAFIAQIDLDKLSSSTYAKLDIEVFIYKISHDYWVSRDTELSAFMLKEKLITEIKKREPNFNPDFSSPSQTVTNTAVADLENLINALQRSQQQNKIT